MGQTGYYRRTDWIPDVKKKKKEKRVNDETILNLIDWMGDCSN